jgi:hypothetical protein
VTGPSFATHPTIEASRMKSPRARYTLGSLMIVAAKCRRIVKLCDGQIESDVMSS